MRANTSAYIPNSEVLQRTFLRRERKKNKIIENKERWTVRTQ